jgi:hypothetical protein
MWIRTEVPSLSPSQVRAHLAGLPRCGDYEVVVRSFRWRTRPRLSGEIDFSRRRILLGVPEPFVSFGEVVAYGARKLSGPRRARSVRLTRGVTFRSAGEALRYLYLHEWMHWYLQERLGRNGWDEVTCERFALRNFRRPQVGRADARAALPPQ